ncbi:MAG TPA: twin-arginine translocase TatA/TatE family subunit [Desulfobacterales bacterium]|nr:twin-arginine translocase TatA/TatE family subunit [Desulfobacterales bacterium]
MFGMGMPEIILILAIALIVLGPKKLPEIAKSLGRGIAEFRKATQDFKENLQVDNDLKEAGDSIRQVKEDLEETVRKSMNGTTAHQKTAAVEEAKLEQPIEKDVTGESEASIEDRPRQETPSKEPVKDA